MDYQKVDTEHLLTCTSVHVLHFVLKTDNNGHFAEQPTRICAVLWSVKSKKQFSEQKKKFKAIFLRKNETYFVSNKLLLPQERETQRPYITSTKLNLTYDTDRFYLQAQQI
jgi:hypothetical protein